MKVMAAVAAVQNGDSNWTDRSFSGLPQGSDEGHFFDVFEIWL